MIRVIVSLASLVTSALLLLAGLGIWLCLRPRKNATADNLEDRLVEELELNDWRRTAGCNHAEDQKDWSGTPRIATPVVHAVNPKTQLLKKNDLRFSEKLLVLQADPLSLKVKLGPLMNLHFGQAPRRNGTWAYQHPALTLGTQLRPNENQQRSKSRN